MAEETKTEETQTGEAQAEQEQAETAPWPEANDHGLVELGGIFFDRSAVQLLETEYTPDEIMAGLKDTNVRSWVRMTNQTHLERRRIGRLVVAGTPTQPIVSGHRFTDWERRR